MNYQDFCNIFNRIIFEKTKSDLLEKIANYPERYIGVFRPTKPTAKILQNLLQSHEIRFGDAFEKLIEAYLIELNFDTLNKNFKLNGEDLKLDQYFKKGNQYYFVEQKIRDDHDSSKKRGQINNFEKKIECVVRSVTPKNNVTGFFYFIDPGLIKNKNYYISELNQISNAYGITIKLCYGNDFFNQIGYPQTWEEILKHLQKWKEGLPELPEINFDAEPEKTFEEIKNLPVHVFRKLLQNENVVQNIFPILFPENKTLKLLKDYFHHLSKKQTIYSTLYNLLEKNGF